MTRANLKNVSLNLFYAVNKLGAELIFSGIVEKKEKLSYENSYYKW